VAGRDRRPGGAGTSRRGDEPLDFCHRLGRVLGEELAGLLGRDDNERFRSRLHRYRHLGR